MTLESVNSRMGTMI